MRPSRRLPLSLFLLAIGGCSGSPPDDSVRWVRVARDANYNIYLDTGRLEQVNGPGYRGYGYSVWYRTDHALPRVHQGNKKLFNRELVQSIVRCDSLKFRVASVDLSMVGERVFVQQRLTEKELMNQKWRSVEMGTAEEMAARAACHFAGAAAPVAGGLPH
jgi:hypothetical protein